MALSVRAGKKKARARVGRRSALLVLLLLCARGREADR